MSHWLQIEFQGQTETWIQLETLSQNSMMQVKFDLEQQRRFRLVQNIQGTECQGTARNAPAWCLGISISYGIFRHSKKAGLWYLLTKEHSWHPPTVICSLDLVFADMSRAQDPSISRRLETHAGCYSSYQIKGVRGCPSPLQQQHWDSQKRGAKGTCPGLPILPKPDIGIPLTSIRLPQMR